MPELPDISKVDKAGRIKGVNRYTKERRAAANKKLTSKQERTAEALTNPATFGEIYLGLKFYPKQREALEACMYPGCMVSIAAANGSGKTALLIPTLVLWHASLWPAGIIKVTSGSYPQIEDQVWPCIRQFKDLFPTFIWRETPRFETRDPFTGKTGFCRCYATDEPGRAEGQHEMGEDRPLLWIGDEAKSLPHWYRGVVEARIRPTRLVLMSSHGFAEGWFYDTQTLLAERPQNAPVQRAD